MRSSSLLCVNHQGSTLHQAGGSLRAYTPYGALANGGLPLIGFTGQPRDQALGYYHLGNGHRSYNPHLMRFHSADTFSPFDRGGLNAYAYCAGDPVNRADPNGRWFIATVQAAVKVVGMVSSTFTFAGAFARTARNVVSRMSPGAATFPDPHISTRTGNGIYGASGTLGVGRGISNLIESGWQSSNLSSPATWLGVGNQLTSIAGSMSSNFLAARDVYRFLRANPRRTGEVLWGTTLEMTGIDDIGSGVMRGAIWTGNTAAQLTVQAGHGLMRMGNEASAYLRRHRHTAQRPTDIEMGVAGVRGA
ncbi:RHS repeat-associated core domain-containing protein [Pseudomonas sp. NPDC089554]|uniref:RHS repeat-associated core domain-containing protein n=1 Tax=Pseudomonas sp. NPDC089554 TaxID=3390653 RepID=UPI003CFD5795